MSKDPFATFENKRIVYHELFKKGKDRGFDMFVASGKENYEKPLTFKNTYQYNGSFFEKYGKIKADAIFDRSGGLSFPPSEIGEKTLNCIEFKSLCNNKNNTENLLGDFMPKSVAISGKSSFLSALALFQNNPLVVLKPAKGMQGKDILINTPAHLKKHPIQNDCEYTLQQFIDTSEGIPGITNTLHDLRVIIVNGIITLCHIRTPKKGSLLANVAQGGSIQEVPLKKIPNYILKKVSKIQNIIDSSFDSPLYSIDFGVHKKTIPFVFEINDQIGFPSEEMRYKAFLENTLNALEKRAFR